MVKKTITKTTRTYSKFAKAAKAANTQRVNASKTKPGSGAIKKLVNSNAKAIASLKESKYGPLQKNYSKMPRISGTGGSVHVTENYPACLHLNQLYSGQTDEPPVKWIQANTQIIGDHAPVMDDYTLINHPFQPMYPLMKDLSEGMPKPNGSEVLWKSTTLKFHFTGWVPETYADIYIVQQKTAKSLPDPWRTTTAVNPHADTYLPYVLPQWRGIGSKPMTGNWIDKSQYNIIQHKKLFLDSVSEIPPAGFFQNTADNIIDSVYDGGLGHGRNPASTKVASTHADRFVSMTITPNMLMKQLKYTHEDGVDNLNFNANAAESKTVGPWSYDNIDPKQNIWAIVTCSDPGHDQLDPTHKVQFTCHRINEWRDLNAQHAA
ncbi:MAG: putative capsid protein [Cressdnaviricota sp.]|nr:MAG: putative capsid protein [Cressdnaviricota sp.]